MFSSKFDKYSSVHDGNFHLGVDKRRELKRRRGLSRKCIFYVQIQAAITGFQTFYWSGRTAYPMNCQNKLV